MLYHVVTHCYAKSLPHYAALLRYHLSGFLLHPPKSGEVSVDVHTTKDDIATVRVLEDFMGLHSDADMFRGVFMDDACVGRRAIGRNFSALKSAADWVIFTDVDHVWQGEALDRIGKVVQLPTNAMHFPPEILIAKDHDVGDQIWRKEGLLLDVDPSLFIPKFYNRAIGGVQIVTGDFARRHGYLNNTHWTSPTSRKPFADFRDDIAYRKFCEIAGDTVKIDKIKGIYRIRHSATSYR